MQPISTTVHSSKTYRFPRLGQEQHEQSSGPLRITCRPLTGEQSVSLYVSGFTAMTTAVVIYTPTIPAANTVPGILVFDAIVQRIETAQAASPILEMRPARRSLRDKAQEEMSEFEREYPW